MLTNTVCGWILTLTIDQFNLELCCKVGVVKALLLHFEPGQLHQGEAIIFYSDNQKAWVLNISLTPPPYPAFEPSHECNLPVISLFEVLARHRLKPNELR